MTSLYDLTPEQQLELVSFARARIAEEKAQRLREIELKEQILDDAETALRAQEGSPNTWRAKGFHSVGEGWPTFMASIVAAPYKDHPDYQPVWDR